MFYCEICKIAKSTLENSSGKCFWFQYNLLNPYTAKDVYLRFFIFLSHFIFLIEAKNKSIWFYTKFWLKQALIFDVLIF